MVFGHKKGPIYDKISPDYAVYWLVLFCRDDDFLSAVRADEFCCGNVASCWDWIFSDVEWCFCCDGVDGCIQCDCDFPECFSGGVSVEVGLDLLSGDSHFFCEVNLCHFPFVEDELDVFFQCVHCFVQYLFLQR